MSDSDREEIDVKKPHFEPGLEWNECIPSERPRQWYVWVRKDTTKSDMELYLIEGPDPDKIRTDADIFRLLGYVSLYEPSIKDVIRAYNEGKIGLEYPGGRPYCVEKFQSVVGDTTK